MAEVKDQSTLDPEIAAINAVVMAIRDLDASTQQNVVDYVVRRFKLRGASSGDVGESTAPRYHPKPLSEGEHEESVPPKTGKGEDDTLEGVSPVARKWMSRNGLSAADLSHLFSLGIEEIDLVAKKVPGKKRKERMLNVILLKGVAAYLGSGVARVTNEQIKETCLHYDAFDSANFATHLKDFSADISGTKETGYTLTARGLTTATQIVKSILNPPTK